MREVIESGLEETGLIERPPLGHTQFARLNEWRERTMRKREKETGRKRI